MPPDKEALQQGTRPRTVRDLVRAELDAGETDLNALWKRLRDEHETRWICWSYLTQIARQWRKEKVNA